MNTIQFRGKRIKVVHYTGQLYRADCERFSIGSYGYQNYREAPMKYFTLEKNETKAYSRRGFPFIKTWQTTGEPLILIDIFHVPTRNALKELIGASGTSHNAINTAFPEHREGFIYRVSEENTKNKDDEVLRSICQLGVFDGYYMGRQTSRGNGLVSTFHSEIGLCHSAFRKIQLIDIEKDPEAPPCIKNRVEKSRKTRRGYLNRNNSNKNKNNNNNNNRNMNENSRNNRNRSNIFSRKRPRINTQRITPPKFSLSMFDD